MGEEERDETRRPTQRIRVDVYHHFPEGAVHVINDTPKPPSGGAVRAKLVLLGANMATAGFTVDDTGRKGKVTFYDDKGNETAAPTGATATVTSDNTAALGVAADPADPTGLTVDFTPTGTEGSGNLTIALANALEADGTTPIPDSSVPFTVGPGPAHSASLVIG